MSVPLKNSSLATWSTNFFTRGSATPSVFGLTTTQMTAYEPLHEAFLAAYQAAAEPESRSTVLVTARNTAKANLLPMARELYGFVQSNTSVTAENRSLIGVKNRAEPSPVPAPTVSPAIDFLQIVGRTVTARVHDDETPRRAKPPGVKGATIFSHVGPTPPADIAAWKFEGSTTKSTFNVVFPSDTPAGAVIWLTALWFNNKSQNGPACEPVSTYLAGGAVTLNQAA